MPGSPGFGGSGLRCRNRSTKMSPVSLVQYRRHQARTSTGRKNGQNSPAKRKLAVVTVGPGPMPEASAASSERVSRNRRCRTRPSPLAGEGSGVRANVGICRPPPHPALSREGRGKIYAIPTGARNSFNRSGTRRQMQRPDARCQMAGGAKCDDRRFLEDPMLITRQGRPRNPGKTKNES